jgi:hypothetical protein
MNSRRMRWVKRAASKREIINTYRILVERKKKGKRGTLASKWDTDILLKWISEKQPMSMSAALIWLKAAISDRLL